MKTCKYIFLAICLCVVACEKDDSVLRQSFVVSGIYTTPSYKTAQIECTIESKNVTIKHVDVHYSIFSDFSKYTSKRMIKVTHNKYSIQLTDLESDELYYIRFSATDAYADVLAKQTGTFETKKIGEPVVTTNTASNITRHSASVVGVVNADGGAMVTTCGICYSTSTNPTTSNNVVRCGEGKGTFACLLTDLKPGIVYYVRAYAVNAKGTSYGNQVSFQTTAAGPVLLNTATATDITISSATVNATIHDDGGAVVTARGICYGTTSAPTKDNNYLYAGTGIGIYTCTLMNLEINTVYYARAYAINQNGIYYGNQIVFTTRNGIVDLGTLSATDITTNSAVVDGNIYNDGGAQIVERGICYSTSSNPTKSNNYLYGGIGTGRYTCSLSHLMSGTVYYARSYAINSTGIYYGKQIVFTTK